MIFEQNWNLRNFINAPETTLTTLKNDPEIINYVFEIVYAEEILWNPVTHSFRVLFHQSLIPISVTEKTDYGRRPIMGTNSNGEHIY